MLSRVLTRVAVLALSLAVLRCDAIGAAGFGGVGAFACPELGSGDALSASFTADARANAKVRTFVLASRDIVGVAAAIETEAAEACRRMGADLAMSPAELAPRDEPGGRASGACNAVAAKIDWILRPGISVQVQATPPSCQANVQAEAQCQGACGGGMQAGAQTPGQAQASGDAECNASCRAHANVAASCTPSQVTVRATQGAEWAGRLAATLQANLPALLHAEIALGRRLGAEAQVVGQVGGQLPKIVGSAGAHALACVSAAAEATARASVSIQVSVKASASVTGRVGASS